MVSRQRINRQEKLSEGLEMIGVKSVEEKGNLRGWLWDYIAAHASLQPVAAVLGAPYGRLSRSKHSRALIEAIAREILLIVDEKGVNKPRSPVDAAYELLAVQGCRPKMLVDLETRRQTEIDYINGLIVKEALRLGLYAPYNDVVYLQVKALEELLA
jgi:2-dehydropantoate 2-reductase